jgi:hypothetical protein
LGVRHAFENVDTVFEAAAKFSAIGFDDTLLRHDGIPSA